MFEEGEATSWLLSKSFNARCLSTMVRYEGGSVIVMGNGSLSGVSGKYYT